MNDLERLNYFDGQRLTAADLRMEQCYQIMARRLMNQGLFTPGVVSGLEIDKVDDTHVRVAQGLALDPRGREIFIAEAREGKTAVQIPLAQPKRGGYYLVIRYRETMTPSAGDGCSMPAGSAPAARIRQEPALEWTEQWPDHQRCAGDAVGQSCLFDATTDSMDCAVVLATVMVKDCQITTIDTATRQYAFPIHVSQLHAFELEGEKDIDVANPKTLTFQVSGGNAQKALLILQGGQFSSLHYTEMGSHSHKLASLSLDPAYTDLGGHIHDKPDHTVKTDPAGEHGHGVDQGTTVFNQDFNAIAGGNNTSTGLDVYTWIGWYPGNPNVAKYLISRVTDHQHAYLVGPTAGPNKDSSTNAHDHSFNSAGIDAAGMATYPVRDGDAYGYLNDLRVVLDDHDITSEIVALFPTWGQLGKGNKDDPLNKRFGTGAIDFVGQLGKAITPIPHTLEFRVASGGGKIMWNLYVE